MILLFSPFLLASHPVNAGPSGWEQPTVFTDDIDIDAHPSLSQAKDGSVWLAWSKYLWDESNTEIFYKTHNGNSWTSETRLTSQSSQDNSPVILSLSNGTVIIAWSSNRSGDFDIYLARIGQEPDQTINLTESLDRARGTGHDEAPTIAETKDAIWVFWQRCTGPECPLNGESDIYHKRYTGLAWDPEQPLIAGAQSDSLVSATASKDGTIWIAWSREQNNLYYKTLDRDSWSPEHQATSTAEADLSPSMFVARDGIIWLFWTRLYDGPNAQNDLYYKTNTNGVWSTETRLTSTTTDELQPTISHGPDRKIWLAYRTNNNPSDTWDLALTRSNQPVLAHDVAIASVQPQNPKTRQGDNATVIVEARNLGDWSETVTVKGHAGIRADVDLDGDVDIDDLSRTQLSQYGKDPRFDIDLDGDIDLADTIQVYITLFTNPRIPIGTKTMTISPNTSIQVNFQWTTTSVAMGQYVFLAEVNPVPNESASNTGDNQAAGGTIQVLRPEDVDLDGDVDLDDLIRVYLALYSSDSRYDIDMDGDVDLNDLIRVYTSQFSEG